MYDRHRRWNFAIGREMKIYICFLCCFFSTFTHADNPFLQGSKQDRVLVIAHRGASAYAPENTMAAFRKAVALGAHMFELDVHISKDEQVVVFHDDTLAKCTNVEDVFPERKPYYVSDFTYEEMKKLDAGSWFVEKMKKIPYREEERKLITSEDVALYKSGAVKIPTLKQALEFAKSKSCYVNVEIKSIGQFYPKIAEKVIRVIKETKTEDLVLISSFDHYQIVACKKIDSEIATAALCAERIFRPGEYCKSLKADAANINLKTIGFFSIDFRKEKDLPLEPIENARRAGIGVNIWTVNDIEQIKVLVKSGVTGIISDYPNRVASVLQNRK